MTTVFEQPWWLSAARGVVAILFGVIAFLSPDITLFSLVTLFAAFSLVSGAVSVFAGVTYRRSNDHWWLMLLWGGVSIGAGAMALLHPALSALVFVLLIAMNALVCGVLDIATAIRLRKHIQGEWLLGLNGAVSIVFGVLVFLFPGPGALALVWYIGAYAVATGILLLVLSLRLRAQSKEPGAMPERRHNPDRRMARA